VIQYDESLSKQVLCITCLDMIIGDSWHSENPLAFNITQTKKEQHYTKYPKNSEIKRERHYMTTVDRPLKNINSVSHR